MTLLTLYFLCKSLQPLRDNRLNTAKMGGCVLFLCSGDEQTDVCSSCTDCSVWNLCWSVAAAEQASVCCSLGLVHTCSQVTAVFCARAGYWCLLPPWSGMERIGYSLLHVFFSCIECVSGLGCSCGNITKVSFLEGWDK